MTSLSKQRRDSENDTTAMADTADVRGRGSFGQSIVGIVPEVEAGEMTRYLIDRLQMEFVNRVIPRDRFVQYEPKDLEWMIPLGMAPVIVIDPAVMQRAAKAVVERLERDVMRPSWCNYSPMNWMSGE